MFFRKNKIKKAFHFLIENGFSLKKYCLNSDEQYKYTKNNIVLLVDYYWAIFPNGENGMHLGVVLTKDGVCSNLLKSNHIFGEASLQALKKRIDIPTPLEQVSIYADFIKTNLHLLLS